MVVTSARFTTLATITGSGGRLDVRRVTVMLFVAVLPAASVAAYVIVFALGTSGTSTENAPPAPSATGLPFTVSVVVVASVTVPLVVTDAALMTSPSNGCVTAITGACVSSVTIRTIVAVFVAASRAVTVSEFAPSASEACPVNTPAASTGRGIPFTSTVTGVASVTVPETVTGVCRVIRPSVGAVTASAGGCVSSVSVCVSVVAFPAASVATVVRVFEPSVNGTDPLKRPSDPTASGAPFTVTVTTVASVTDPDAVTGVWFVMNPFAGAVTARTGGCVSRMTVRGWLVALLAASVAVTVRVLLPSVSVTAPVNAPVGSTGNGMPFTSTVTGVASVTVPETVTGVARVIRPSVGAVTASTGGCVSSVTARVLVVAFPAASVATVVRVFGPSVNGTDPLKWPSGPTVSAVPVRILLPSVTVIAPVNAPVGSTGSGTPFTFTVTAVRSVTVPETVTLVCLVIRPSLGLVSVSTGGW